MVFDSDDFGVNHVISDQCQSHDCRDILDKLHIINPAFKATLFTIPGEMSGELLGWCAANSGWIELAQHGFFHRSNYECADMTYEEFDRLMSSMDWVTRQFLGKGFKAPGWQISDACYEWLYDHGWWVADQAYNNHRRPEKLPAYVVDGSSFIAFPEGTSAEKFTSEYGVHTHTWDCVGNGVYELYDQLADKVRDCKEFKFISEVLV